MTRLAPEKHDWHKLGGRPGTDWQGAEFGGVTVQLEMIRRVAEVHICTGGEALPDDIMKAIALLASRGLVFPGEFAARYADSGVFVFTKL
jgi:hypothetical protein